MTDYSALAAATPAALAAHLLSLGDNDTMQAWIEQVFADMEETGEHESLGKLAWACNDIALLLNRGHQPEEIRKCPYRGFVAGLDDEPIPELPTRHSRLSPGYVPPFGFVVGADGGLLPEQEPDETPRGQTGGEDGEPCLWPAGDGSIAHMLRTPPPELTWFCRDRLLSNRAHLLVGIGGSSKTRALIQLAMAAVTGRLAWAWEIERTGSAVLILAEDTQEGFHRTLAAILEHGSFSHQERALLAERLHVFPLAGQDTKLLALQPGGVLVETSHFTGLVERCKRIPDLAFIGLDPALGLTEGDENSQTHQRRLGSLCDRLAIESAAAVVLVAHAAKALQSAEEVGSHSSRGGGAITDAVRAEFTLRTMTAPEARAAGITDLEERKAHVQLVATKGNELPPAAFVPIWLKRGNGGVLAQVELEQAGDRGGIGRREAQALAILKELAAVSTPAMREWRTACQEAGLLHGENERAHERAMERIRDRLRDASLIAPGMTRGIWLPTHDDE